MDTVRRWRCGRRGDQQRHRRGVRRRRREDHAGAHRRPSAYALWSTVAQGLTWAADHGARVANISYEGASASSTIQSAASYFRSKGGVVFAAAGNTGGLDNTAPTGVMTIVAATQETDTVATWSTYGSFVDISAPGNNILTTAKGGGYQYWWGTSLATPVAAATAALILSRRPDLTPAQVDAALTSSATDKGTAGYDIHYGAGRVNAAAALQQVGGIAPPPPVDVTAPTVAIASPTGGSVAGTITVGVNASDNVGVVRVDLRVNGATVVSDTSAPWQASWNSASAPNGSVTLTAAAYDAAGNYAVSTPVVVTVAKSCRRLPIRRRPACRSPRPPAAAYRAASPSASVRPTMLASRGSICSPTMRWSRRPMSRRTR